MPACSCCPVEISVIRLTETIRVHFFGRAEAEKREQVSKLTERLKNMERYPKNDFVQYFGKLQNLKCECKSFVEAKPQHIQFEAHDHQNAQFKVKTNNSKSRLQCSIAHSLKPPSFSYLALFADCYQNKNI